MVYRHLIDFFLFLFCLLILVVLLAGSAQADEMPQDYQCMSSAELKLFFFLTDMHADIFGDVIVATGSDGKPHVWIEGGEGIWCINIGDAA